MFVWRRLLSRVLPALAAVAGLLSSADATGGAEIPNILWLTSEDHGPQMGCYGDSYATTPNIDALAAKGLKYQHAWSTAPVCAAARTALISGLYPSSLGAHHMRSMVPLPAGMAMYPQLLRQAGYFCTNNNKEDYNLIEPGAVWDESSKQAHWSHRRPNQPFFAIFNSTRSHESQVRSRPHTLQHDPAKVRIPAYHPDTPETRHDWAQYYDGVTAADADAGARLKELHDAGLAEKTIVFYYADHGPGLPRCKRWPYNSGLQVPLVIYIPEAFKNLRPPDYRPGGTSSRLVGFVDFAPTLLSLAGIQPPSWMQGQAFLGPFAAPPPAYLFGLRGRMDERYDLVHTVTDGRLVYVRNYMPHRTYGEHISYLFQMPTTQVWKARHDAGTLTPEQDAFWKAKPPEELYDLEHDPDEVHNLAASPSSQADLARLRAVQRAHLAAVRDVGFLPEHELFARSRGTSPYEVAHNDQMYPFERLFATSERAARRDAGDLPALHNAAADPDSAVRFWAIQGFLIRGEAAAEEARAEILRALEDPAPDVQIAAAECLGRFGRASDLSPALSVLLDRADWSRNDVFVVIASLNAIDALGPRASGIRERLARLPRTGPVPHPRYAEYVPRLLAYLSSGTP